PNRRDRTVIAPRENCREPAVARRPMEDRAGGRRPMMVDDNEFRKRFLRAQRAAQEAQSGGSAEPPHSEEPTAAPPDPPAPPGVDNAQETAEQPTEPPPDLDSPPSPSARIESALARIAAATCGKAAGVTAATGPPDALRR